MQSRNEIDFQKSRNGLIVPVINGVYLHSIYNPSKEAVTFAQNHNDLIQKKNHILILGLGFGYHIEEIAKSLSEYHESYSVVVIEKNEELLKSFKEQKSFSDTNIKLINEDSIEKLYRNRYLVDILIQKPGIIKLDSAFNLDKDFYKSFLTYKASHEINDYHHTLNPIATKLIGKHNESFHTTIKNVKSSQSISNKSDYLLLALSEIASNKNDEVTQ